MWKNYLKIAFRNLLRNRIFSFINIFGLSLGISAFILILQFVSFEYSYNKFHKEASNTYRVLFEANINGKNAIWDFLPPGLAPATKMQFAEVKNYCRLADGISNGVVSYDNEKGNFISFRENKIAYVDGSFFMIFSFPLLKGTDKDLIQPNTVFISEAHAKKYFSHQNPLGKTLILNNQFGKTPFKVSGVFKNMPANSDLQYDMVFSLQTLANPANLNGNDWAKLDGLTMSFVNVYLLLQPKASAQALENKINVFKKKVNPESKEKVSLQALQNIHLATSFNDQTPTYGNVGFVYLLSGVALMILVIAWFNYINLSTATALKRAKEVGIRKVIGANRRQLIFQFLSESLVLNLLGLIGALLLVELSQNLFNILINKPLSITTLSQNWFWLGGLALLLLGTLASGAYTAFALTSYQPTQTLKGVFAKSTQGLWLRKTLVVFQFSISILLVISTLVVYRQLKYMQNQDLGMNIEQLLVIKGADVGKDSTYSQRKKVFLDKISQLPYIQHFSTSGVVPGSWYNFNTAGITRLNPQNGDENKSYAMVIIDHRFLPTYQIKLVAGNNFTPTMCNKSWDENNKLIINEKACNLLGFTSPTAAVGQKIKWDSGDGKKEYEVIGIIKDYNHQSLHQLVEPMLFVPQLNGHYYTLRLPNKQMQAKIQELGKLYHTSFAGNPFEYYFINESYNRQYQSELRFGQIFTLASSLAIFIACLGLFGLATFTVEARTKEIGIRKVLGATATQIVGLISKDFLRLVMIAFVIASPLAYYIAQYWLQNFAYRTPIYWWLFALAGGLALGIAVITIAFQAFRASQTNPVESLKYE